MPDGVIVVEGKYDSSATEKVRGTAFVAEFAPSGKLLRIAGNALEAQGIDQEHKKLRASPSVHEGGRLYLVDGEKITVMSEGGHVERTFRISKPEPDYFISRIQPSRGRLGVWFHKTVPHQPLVLRFEIVDSITGQAIARYEPDAQLGNNAACYDGESLIFLTIKGGYVNLRTASVR
jgi:hypothetical protein